MFGVALNGDGSLAVTGDLAIFFGVDIPVSWSFWPDSLGSKPFLSLESPLIVKGVFSVVETGLAKIFSRYFPTSSALSASLVSIIRLFFPTVTRYLLLSGEYAKMLLPP